MQSLKVRGPFGSLDLCKNYYILPFIFRSSVPLDPLNTCPQGFSDLPTALWLDIRCQRVVGIDKKYHPKSVKAPFFHTIMFTLNGPEVACQTKCYFYKQQASDGFACSNEYGVVSHKERICSK